MTRGKNIARETIREAIQACLSEGVRDGAGGGVHASHIVERIDRSSSAVRKRLHAMETDGEVVQVWGIEGEPRASWLPADHPDAESATEDRTRGYQP